MQGSDAALARAIARYASELLAQIPQDESVSSRVRNVVIEQIHDDVSIAAVAKKMAMSPRTLQRRLREERASHTGIVDDVRRSLAMDYVKTAQLGLGEVALLLGYSEMSSFHHAFKRWHGHSPSHFRPKS